MVKNFDKHADNHQKVVKIEIVVDKSEDMARKKYGPVGVFFFAFRFAHPTCVDKNPLGLSFSVKKF